MNRAKRILIVVFLCIALIAGFVAGWMILPSRGVPVLTYHHIGDSPEWYYLSAADFDRQMAFIKKEGYTAISVVELTAALAGSRPLPPKPIVITFDDGYEDNWTVATPILEKHGLRATFFVVTGKIGKPEYMTWPQLQAMQAKGMEIGSHTVNHYTLNEINLKEFTRELLLSRLMLENNLFHPVEIFANPFGETTPAVVELLGKTGYRAACSSIFGSNFSGENPYLLKRMTVPKPLPGLGLWDFRARLLRLEAVGKI